MSKQALRDHITSTVTGNSQPLRDIPPLSNYAQLAKPHSWEQRWDPTTRTLSSTPVPLHGLVWSDAIEASLADHNGVNIPASDQPLYLERPIIVTTGTQIIAHPETEIRMIIGDTEHCLIQNRNLVSGQQGPVELCANADRDILIQGGIWSDQKNNGAGPQGFRDGKFDLMLGSQGAIVLSNVQDLTIRNVTVRDNSSFGFQIGNVRNFLVDGACVDGTKDGVHIEGPAEGGIIRNVFGPLAGDDVVALNAWDWRTSSLTFGSINDILIEDAAVDSGSCAIRILPGVRIYPDGTTQACDINRCLFSDIRNCHSFKIYDQPNVRCVHDDYSAALGLASDLYFENLQLVPLDLTNHHDTSKNAVFELCENIRGFHLDGIHLAYTPGAPYPDYLISIGPKSCIRPIPFAASGVQEIFNASAAPVVEDLTLANIYTPAGKHAQPDDLVQRVEPPLPVFSTGGCTLQTSVQGTTLRAESATGDTWVECAISATPRYTTYTITGLHGVSDSLHAQVPDGWHVTELDYMTTRDRQTPTKLSWFSPSQHFGVNPPGAFAMFAATSDEAHDETLLHIWVNENLPHPTTGQPWDLAHARAWLTAWQERFASRSQMVVNAESLQELYDLVPYAERAAIDEIYIFTNTWRPDPFWPMTAENWALNPKVFPNGRADLRAYSDHLSERGIRLCLHYVSGGIGLYDPQFVPHSELAAWSEGTLPQAIDATRTEFAVDGGGIPDDRSWLNHTVLQIEDELIVPGEERGAYNTTPAAHAAGSPVRFLVVPYGQNFVPDNNSPLLYRVADEYAALLNDCNIAHVEFDGAEIHCYDGNYGYIKFAQRIYEQVDHPVTSHDSSGCAARCFFEYRFKRSQHILRGSCSFSHGGWNASMQIDSLSRPASTVMDAHFFLSQGHWGGAQGLTKPEPMFGITTAMLQTHGLTEDLLKTLHDWKALVPQLSDEQHQAIEDSLRSADWPMPEASNHRVADTVFCARDGKLIQTQAMTRASGDSKWLLGQEYGTLSPRQFLAPGQSIELHNRYHQQTPRLLLRVLPTYDQATPTIPVQSSLAAATISDAKDFFVQGNESTASQATVTDNLDLLPADFDGLLQDARDTDTYRVRDLPAFPLLADLSHHRGLAVDIEGDGSGALLLIQLEGKGCRDYVIPIDFSGRRVIEVPCGEASWARADWGWRMGTKTMDYANVAQCRVGLGMIPGGRRVSIRVHGLTALAERHEPCISPTIQLGDSTLQLHGEIPHGHYLIYDGQARVYDPNWHQTDALATSGVLLATPGPNTLRLTASHWTELQLLVEDAQPACD